MIRALYGHSIRVDPGVPLQPPEHLYHGTARRTLSAILRHGLLPVGRQHVHLSVDQATAAGVGRRKDRAPVVVRVAAREAGLAGVAFYRGSAQVWLANAVPPDYLQVLDG
jgi:putative RNA 2'-phosphotransferase